MSSNSESIKIVLIGESGVGKTSIISQFVNQVFQEDVETSSSGTYNSKTLIYDNNKVLKLEIWDTAGQEKFHSLAKIFYRDAKVICLVYDITLRDSFEKMKSFWYEQEVLLNADGQPIFAVVGNKFDLYESREVNDDEALEFAKSIRAIFQYTSAKNSSGINELFFNIGNKCFNPDFNLLEKESRERELYEKKKLDKEKNKKENKGKEKIKLDKENKKDNKSHCC
jgi:small GTP-binding protein